MIEINRTFDYAKGLTKVEDLSGVTFSAESFAHTFNITRTDDYGYEGEITARFVRGDGVTVFVEGAVATTGNKAVVDLPPECYAAPGPFLLVIFHVIPDIDQAYAIYAARGTVLASESGTTIAASGTMDNIEAQIQAILNRLSGTINTANLVALFARNIGEVEGDISQFQTTVDGITDALAAANLQALNEPNLLKQDDFWTNNVSEDIIYGDASMWLSSSGAYMKSISANRKVEFDHEPTAEESAGAYRIYHRTAGEDSSGNTWTEAWIVHWLVDDSIQTSCVTLTGDDIIHEVDGEDFTKAIQYNITENSAYGNMETLYWKHGQRELKYTAGQTPPKAWAEIEEMEVGKTYTVSCWGRVISGAGAWLKFGWGGTYYNSIGYPSDKAGVSDWKELTSTSWTRLYWTFKFEPTGAYYTEATADGTTTRTFNWSKRVAIGVGRKFTSVIQLCGFRLTQGGLYGNNTVDTLQLNVEDTMDQVEAALSSIAPVESGATASTNYAAGALIVWKGRLYKTSDAVATGATWAVGTNLTATTLAAELAALST